jgi:phosphoribosylaminoimidazole-succinocarboxamide synthase
MTARTPGDSMTARTPGDSMTARTPGDSMTHAGKEIMSHENGALFESRLAGLELINRGKVRDIYAVDERHMLVVTSDRLSAFDVVLPDPIPGKGVVLNDLSDFWFERTRDLVPNHQSALALADVVSDPEARAVLGGRARVVRRLRPLPVEAIVRGYLIGSGWKDYQATGAVCGIALPRGLRQAARLPQTLFTPSTKAQVGDHDENIEFDAMCALVGAPIAERVRELTVRIYEEAAQYAAARGIIIADTKLEFGLDDDDEVVLIDEVLTPDSSRFWPASSYAPGSSPPSFDKQFVRDYLERIGWDKHPPAPHLPPEVIARTAQKYAEARDRLIGGD